MNRPAAVTAVTAPEVAALSAATLDALGSAVTVLDATGVSLVANRAARAIIDSADGLSHGPKGLRALAPPEDAMLQRLIRAATRVEPWGLDSTGLMRISRPSQRRAYVVAVSPLRTALAGPPCLEGQAVLSIRDPDGDVTTAPEVLRDLWGLTNAEARVCSELVRGRSVAGIATLLRVEADTIRKHVKQIFGKTGTNRQAALTSLVLSSLVGLSFPMHSPNGGGGPTVIPLTSLNGRSRTGPEGSKAESGGWRTSIPRGRRV